MVDLDTREYPLIGGRGHGSRCRGRLGCRDGDRAASKQLAKTAMPATLSEQIGARLNRAQARLGPMGPRGRCRGLISASRRTGLSGG